MTRKHSQKVDKLATMRTQSIRSRISTNVPKKVTMNIPGARLSSEFQPFPLKTLGERVTEERRIRKVSDIMHLHNPLLDAVNASSNRFSLNNDNGR